VVDKADLDALANIGPEIDSGAEPGLDTSICRTFPAFLPVAPAGHALVVEGGAWQDALTIGWAIAGVFRRDLYLNVRLIANAVACPEVQSRVVCAAQCPQVDDPVQRGDIVSVRRRIDGIAVVRRAVVQRQQAG